MGHGDSVVGLVPCVQKVACSNLALAISRDLGDFPYSEPVALQHGNPNTVSVLCRERLLSSSGLEEAL